MHAQKRRNQRSVIDRLLAEPYRFDFFQAVRLLERWIARSGVSYEDALNDVLRFQNSVALSFPASQIEALHADADAAIDTEAALLAALLGKELKRVCITPAFIGLLGGHGALPLHYTERIAANMHLEKDDGPRAFMDTFSNRLVAMFYQAWAKYRLELSRTPDGKDGLLPLLLALSGTPPGGGSVGVVPDAVAAHYAAAFMQRPVSAIVIQRVLADYFGVPVTVRGSQGHWHALEPDLQATLGGPNACVGVRCIVGTHVWRRDLRVRINMGPLTKTEYDSFLPGCPGAVALKKMLSMFRVETLEFEVHLLLQGRFVKTATLDGSVRLGYDAFMVGEGAHADREGTRYMLTTLCSSADAGVHHEYVSR